MLIVLRQVWESLVFAFNALRTNLTRTILSLLGVTVGIFAIIAVFTLVDSLETKLKSSFDFLGSENLNVDKWPYALGPDYPWWKYLSRPYPDYEEFKFLQANLSHAEGISINANRSGVTAKFENSSYPKVDLTGVSYGYQDVLDVSISEGRYFTIRENERGSNVAIIGHKIKSELFPLDRNPIGKTIRLKNIKFVVIGVMKEEGEGFLGLPSNDEKILIPYQSMRKLYFLGRYRGLSSTIAVKARPGDDLMLQLEGELKGLMRIKRGLKPTEEDDFAINRPEAIAKVIGTTFDVISIAGWIIGSFSILVGGFGIANIMFVSVKERTPIIGIQKSLGAKNYFILLQFLFESIFLSVIGGLVGMMLVYGLTFIELGSLTLVLSIKNVFIGLLVSILIGVISGIVPAAMAARLDPVVAIRA